VVVYAPIAYSFLKSSPNKNIPTAINYRVVLCLSAAYRTIVRIYDGKKVKAFVRGIDLDGIVDEFAKYDFLVTYNGTRFDLPFIKHEYPEIEFNQMHTDMTYPLRRIGYTGSLKAIEQVLGVTRSEDMTGITGFDAVRLWNEYERGSNR